MSEERPKLRLVPGEKEEPAKPFEERVKLAEGVYELRTPPEEIERLREYLPDVEERHTLEVLNFAGNPIIISGIKELPEDLVKFRADVVAQSKMLARRADVMFAEQEQKEP